MIAEILSPMRPDLSSAQLAQFETYYAMLADWNTRVNLTAITAPEDVAKKHFLDSLAAAPYLKPNAAVADVGTGAGFPGLPLAIVDPARRYTLIDSNNKKVRFVGHAARTLGLANVEPLHARVEDLSPAVSFDTVVARAFAPLPRLLALVRPLCGPQTRVLAMKGARLDEELPGIGADWRLDAVVPLHVPRLEASRSLAILRLSA